MAVAPIHIAARTRDVETLRSLLAEGVSPDLVGGDSGRTPLLFLCVNPDPAGDRVACFKLLRDAGANLDATSGSSGLTALHYRALNGDATMMSLLVEAGATVDAVNAVGWTALHFAALYFRRGNCVEVLLAAGASVNARTFTGDTPFRMAHMGSRRAWPMFLRAGAEIPTDETQPYILRVRSAGGFQRYAQEHLARITSILAPTPRLPPEMVRKIVEFWLHAGYY
mmetsp:Transcript_15468/g.40769  ORF Transcript_15468/g.40769 Transcript_15468/m.40769 type:complete len:225 (+) Transcript_15468:142-816(+)